MRTFIFGFVFVFSAAFNLDAAERSIPSLTGPVIDEAQILSRGEVQRLESYIRDMMPAIQGQVWIVPELQGEAIESLAIRAVDRWKLGTEKKDNGLLLLISRDDRRMRIEVGQGLEGELSDLMTRRIIDRVMAPRFREQKFYEGIRNALQASLELATSQNPALKDELSRKSAKSGEGNVLPVALFIILFIAFFFINIFFSGMRRSGASGWSGGWHGGGGRGFGGGGWSGGGGGFSGGGSSGSW